jgi:hypothetical protein
VSDCNINYSITAIRSRGEETNPDPSQAVADRAQLLDYYDALEAALMVAIEDYEAANGRWTTGKHWTPTSRGLVGLTSETDGKHEA